MRSVLMTVALALGLARAQAGDFPLCRVTATYTPVAWPFWTPPEQRFRSIHVLLRPDCPPNGEANVLLYNPVSGRVLPEQDAYTLNRYGPSLRVSGLTPGWVVLWRSQNGRTFRVPQVSTLGGAP